MVAGIRVINDNGFVQIDENYRNLAMILKGKLIDYPTYFWPTGPSGGLAAYTVTVDAVCPVVAMLPGIRDGASGYITGFRLQTMSRSGTTWTLTFLAMDGRDNNHIFYVFDVPPALTTSYGLAVWDAAGRLSFASEYKYLRITAANPPAAGRKTAIIESRASYQYFQDMVDPSSSQFNLDVLAPFYYFDPSNNQIKQVLASVSYTGPYDASGTTDQNGAWIYADVTHY